MVLLLTFRFFYLFWVYFCTWFKVRTQIHCFAYEYPIFLVSYVEKTVLFSPVNGLSILVKISWQYMQVFISELLILFHLSICLSLCEYHTAGITAGSFGIKKVWVLQWWSSFPRLLWLSRIHRNIRMHFSISAKNIIEILKSIILNLYITLGSINMLSLSSNPWSQNVFPFIYVFFSFFQYV